MARRRKMSIEELHGFAIFDRSLTPERIEMISQEVRFGSQLELEESSFEDVIDYTAVILDGIRVARSKGY